MMVKIIIPVDTKTAMCLIDIVIWKCHNYKIPKDIIFTFSLSNGFLYLIKSVLNLIEFRKPMKQSQEREYNCTNALEK